MEQLALIIYENCQQFGVVTNLKTSEFKNHQATNDGMVVTPQNVTTGDDPASDFKIHQNSSQTLLCLSSKKAHS